MYYNGKNYNSLATFLVEKKKEWLADKRKPLMEMVKSWEDEGIVWAVQEYYSSMGEFSDDDIKTIKECFGQWAGDVIDLCKSEE